MPSFTMDDLKKAVYGNAFNAQELTAKQAEERKPMAGRRGKRTAEQSEVLIREFILNAPEPVTMLQICDSIQRAPSPFFRAMVARMVAAGEVAKVEDIADGGNLPRFWYWHP